MEGTLYKQQDIFKRWKPRYFVLKENSKCLQYYLNRDDNMPRKTMDISECQITDVKKGGIGSKKGGKVYYQFTISCAKSPSSYKLASPSMNQAQLWISALQSRSSISHHTTESAFQRESIGNLVDHIDGKSKQHIQEDSSVAATLPVTSTSFGSSESIRTSMSSDSIKADTLTEGMPSAIVEKLEKAVEMMLAAVSETNPYQWTKRYSKKDINVYKAQRAPIKASASCVCVLGNTTFDYPILEVFGTLMNQATVPELNPQIVSVKTLQTFNRCSFVEHVKCVKVFPTAARDYANLVHWRLLPDGKVVVAVIGDESFDEKWPPQRGDVRGVCLLGGYVIQSRGANRTEVDYILQADLNGSLPASICDIVATQQPMLLANARTIIEKNRNTKSVPPTQGSPATLKFEDYLYAFTHPNNFNGAVKTISRPRPLNEDSQKTKQKENSFVEEFSESTPLDAQGIKNLGSSLENDTIQERQSVPKIEDQSKLGKRFFFGAIEDILALLVVSLALLSIDYDLFFVHKDTLFILLLFLSSRLVLRLVLNV